ncbi:hypothetical protein AB3S75_024110 [Citrus x aurantiifolia]
MCKPTVKELYTALPLFKLEIIDIRASQVHTAREMDLERTSEGENMTVTLMPRVSNRWMKSMSGIVWLKVGNGYTRT